MSRRTALQPGFGLKQAADEHRLEATLEFITPMFGGGVALMDPPHHKPPDGVTPVRGASLRGQLRAWWRRTCCEGLAVNTMRAREKLLWGWASTQDEAAKGRVSLTVDARGLNRWPVSVDDLKAKHGYGTGLEYGAFPLQDRTPDRKAGDGTLTVWTGAFKVCVALAPLGAAYVPRVGKAWNRVLDSEAELRKALWAEATTAWLAFVTFGGLGGRTRRGFGAVRATTGPGSGQAVQEVAERLGWQQRVAVRSGPSSSAEAAHEIVLRKLMTFRQGENLGRNPRQEPNRPGRSRWPEPDAIRVLLGTHLQTDAKEHRPKDQPRVFARAAFGMPIIIKFKDDDARKFARAEPGKTSLQPRQKDRLASPIIVRPVASGRERYLGVALRLPDPPGEHLAGILNDLSLKVVEGPSKGSSFAVRGLLTPDEAASIRPLADQGLRGLSGADAVLNAFLAYFKQT